MRSITTLNRYNVSLISLALLITVVSLITYYRIKIQMDLGPIWDTYDFLSDALLFAGQGTGYSDLTRPPLLPFLTSIFFRLGYVSSAAIFVVDGLLFIFGVAGLFLLLKLRFNDMESFLGSLLYATFPIVISFAGVGLSDIPSVSFSIGAVYFTILAVKSNSKFFYLSFPFIMLAFLTRYPSALLIFPIALYILVNIKSILKIRDVFTGIIASLILLVPVLNFFYDVYGNPFYSFLNFFGSSSGAPTGAFAYNSNIFYFLEYLPSFIGAQGFAIIFIIIMGFAVYELINFKKKPTSKTKLFNALHTDKKTKIKLISIAVLTLIFLGTFSQIFWMWSEILFFGLAYVSYDLLKNRDIKYLDMHLLIFSWFMAFFIFHSVYVVKDGRYFVTMAPAVAYFLVLGMSEVLNKSGFKIKNINATSCLFSIILIFMIISSTASYLPGIQEENNNLKVMDENIDIASQWLINYDPGYKNKIIYSDLWPYSGWYLKMNIGMMPTFKDGHVYYTGAKDYSSSQQDSIAADKYLVTNNAQYCFSSLQKPNLTSYKPVKQFGNVIIYQRI